MKTGRLLLASVGASLSLGCALPVIVATPKWPPCYLDDATRHYEAHQLKKKLPACYAWVREMDAICVAWTEK